MPPSITPESQPDASRHFPGHGVAPPRKPTRAVQCIRCSEILYYPVDRPSRFPMLYCGRCGARTRIPTIRTRVLQVASILLYFAAIAMIVIFSLRKGI